MQPCDGWPPAELAALVAMLEREVVGGRAPRIVSVPGYARSLGHEALEVAEAFGIVPDPWQRETVIDACGVRPDGKWAAFEVGLNVPRQNGKGGIIEIRELAGVFAWGERLIIHSAHEFATSMEAFLRMEEILAGTPEYAAQVSSVSRSHGSEGFIFKTGQRLRYRTRTKGGGRGFTGDTLILDEGMILQETFVGALVPTLAAKSMLGNPQVFYAGSAVDQTVHEHGFAFARLRGRALRGDDPSLAWFEWCATAPFDEFGRPITPDHPWVEELLDDLDGWAAANPALGIRISSEHVEKERRSMGDRTFAVERLGIGDWPDLENVGDSPITLESWNELVDADSKIATSVAFAFDVSPNRASGTIAAAGRRADGRAHVEVLQDDDGTNWIVDELVRLNGEHENLGVFCDGVGPASSLIPELELRGVTVTTTTATELARACGLLFDEVAQRTLRHLGTKELSSAIRGAATRSLGDAWAWARRKATVNITPLMAVTLALWGARTVQPPKRGSWKPL